MDNQIIKHLHKREKIRIKKLSMLSSLLSYSDYQNIQPIFSNDSLYYSSHEIFYNQKQKNYYHISEWIYYFMIDKTIQLWLNKNHSLDTIKILDPCCGSGHFSQIIIEYLFIKFKSLYPNQSETELLNKIISQHIHSWDSRPESVHICRNRIKNIFNVDPVLVQETNTLLEQSQFDVIIGQPLHGDLLSDYLKNKINTVHNDVSIDFYNWSLNSLNPNGEVCLIIPHYLSYLNEFQTWRKSLFQSNSIHEIIDIGNDSKKLLSEFMIIHANNSQNLSINSSSFKDFNYHETIPAHLFFNNKFSFKFVLYWTSHYQKYYDNNYKFLSIKMTNKQINHKKISIIDFENFLSHELKNNNIENTVDYINYFKKYIINNASSFIFENSYLKEFLQFND